MTSLALPDTGTRMPANVLAPPNLRSGFGRGPKARAGGALLAEDAATQTDGKVIALFGFLKVFDFPI